MNRWLMIGSMVGLLTTATGCLHHRTRGGCNTCHGGGHAASAHGGGAGGGGVHRGRVHRGAHAAGRAGHAARPLPRQPSGRNYGGRPQPGALGHGAAAQLQNQPFQPGPPSAQVAYPYYSHRGPRDFLLDDPPTIGR